MSKRKIPRMCITCQHYEPYHCTLDDSYIGYLYCAEPTKCRAWDLSEKYKTGGKFYDETIDEARKAREKA